MFVCAAVFHVLRTYGAFWLPRSFAQELTLDAFMGLVQLVTIGIGLGLTRVLVDDPWRSVGLTQPSGRAVGMTLGLVPLAFVIGTGSAFLIARPTLIQEILQGGTQAAQQNSGEFGRQLVQAPVWEVLLWGAILSPIGEELFFRGALWSLFAEAVKRAAAPSPVKDAPPSLPVELMNQSPLSGASRSAKHWFVEGGVATIASTALFAVLHRDMPGGLGIVRFVSALVLGLACSLARQHGKSVAPAIVLHVLWNVLSVAAVRRWIVTETFPTKYSVPTLLALIAVFTTTAVLAGWLGSRKAQFRLS